MPHRTDDHHHTAADVRRYLAAACELVQELELDDDLKVPAFTKAVDLLASKQIFYEQPAAVPLAMQIPRNRG